MKILNWVSVQLFLALVLNLLIGVVIVDEHVHANELLVYERRALLYALLIWYVEYVLQDDATNV